MMQRELKLRARIVAEQQRMFQRIHVERRQAAIARARAQRKHAAVTRILRLPQVALMRIHRTERARFARDAHRSNAQRRNDARMQRFIGGAGSHRSRECRRAGFAAVRAELELCNLDALLESSRELRSQEPLQTLSPEELAQQLHWDWHLSMFPNVALVLTALAPGGAYQLRALPPAFVRASPSDRILERVLRQAWLQQQQSQSSPSSLFSSFSRSSARSISAPRTNNHAVAKRRVAPVLRLLARVAGILLAVFQNTPQFPSPVAAAPVTALVRTTAAARRLRRL